MRAFGVDVGIDPYKHYRWFSEVPGDCHTSVATLVRNDMRLTGGNDNFYFGDTYRLHNWRN